MENGIIYVVFMVMVGRTRGFILGVGTPWMGIELNSFRALQRNRTVSVRFLIPAWSIVRACFSLKEASSISPVASINTRFRCTVIAQNCALYVATIPESRLTKWRKWQASRVSCFYSILIKTHRVYIYFFCEIVDCEFNCRNLKRITQADVEM